MNEQKVNEHSEYSEYSESELSLIEILPTYKCLCLHGSHDTKPSEEGGVIFNSEVVSRSCRGCSQGCSYRCDLRRKYKLVLLQTEFHV